MHRRLLAAVTGALALFAAGGVARAVPSASDPAVPAGSGGSAESVAPPCPPGGGEVAATDATTTPAPTTGGATTAPSVTVAPLSIPLPGSGGGSGPEASGPPVSIDQALVLGRDGLGAVGQFCDDPDAVIAAMSRLAGAPDDDTGWVDPLSISTCRGTEVRRVTWGSLDLYFGDESRFAGGVRHFFGFSYGNIDGFDVAPAGLATPEGVGLGTPVTYLRATYADVAILAGEEGIQEPAFYVDENLRGLLTDDTDDGVITLIIGGEACGV